jgi:uncharacterized Zn finger protein
VNSQSPAPNASNPQPPQNSQAAGGKRFADRKPEGPRRVRHGLKLQGDFDFGLSAVDQPRAVGEPQSLAQRWYALASSAFDRETMLAGYEYAKSGQTVSLDLQKGLIRAAVQGTAPRPYQVEIGLPAFDETQWQHVIEAMSGEAVYVAKMLTGELPQGIDELLAPSQGTKDERMGGLRLLPQCADQLRFSCTCPAAATARTTGVAGCKHQATALIMATERLHEHPLLIFTLLGMSADQLLERLRKARTIQAKGIASAHGDPLIPETQIEPPPLEACIDDYWHPPHVSHMSGDQPDLDPATEATHGHSAHAPHAAHALLRRLGPSPLKGKFPMVGLLASVYDTVAQAARKLAYEENAER